MQYSANSSKRKATERKLSFALSKVHWNRYKNTGQTIVFFHGMLKTLLVYKHYIQIQAKINHFIINT